ncbi:uncharacterized protein V2V93DRAFT_200721 [Kockiozyma suomiensis]|uniref:uncharacterized protein n=1 Tax=Kockiozyma suomiensis TaxID=1337062 RepID=UPI003343ECC3
MAAAQEEHILLLEQQVGLLRDDLADLQRERKHDIHENEKLYLQIETLEKDNEQRGKDADRWRHRFITVKQEMETSKQQIESLQNAVNNRDKSNRELANSKIQLISDMKAMNDRLKDMDDDMRALSRANAELLERVQEYEVYSNDLIGQNEALQNQVYEHEAEILKLTRDDEDHQYKNTQSISRRSSASVPPNRRLSDELSAEYVRGENDSVNYDEDEGSGATLINEMDDMVHMLEESGSPGHNDIRKTFNKLKSSNGLDNIRHWSTPEQLSQILEQWRSMMADMNISLPKGSDLSGEAMTGNMGALQTVIASLAKQQYMIQQLVDSEKSIDFSAVSRMTKGSEADHSTVCEEPAKTEKPAVSQQPSESLSERQLARANRVPGFRLAGYLLPRKVLEDFRDDSPDTKLLIRLYFYAIFILGVVLAIGLMIGYGASQLFNPTGGCYRGMSYRSPWWVGSPIPYVEKIMYNIEGWYLDRYERVS